MKHVKPPKAPRRYQAEVDAIRHEANQLRAKLRAVRWERRLLRNALKDAAGFIPADQPEHRRATEALNAWRRLESDA